MAGTTQEGPNKHSRDKLRIEIHGLFGIQENKAECGKTKVESKYVLCSLFGL